MKNSMFIIQIILAVVLTGSILLQQRGTGLGGVFGGEGNVYRSRRGIEKFLFISTFVIAALFVVAIILSFKF